MSSRGNSHTTSSRARDCTRMQRRNEVDTFLRDREHREAERSSRNAPNTRELESNSPSLQHHREFFRKRQEEFESKSESEESEGDDEDSGSDGDDTSEDEIAGKVAGDLEPAGSSDGIAPAGKSSIDTLAPGTSTPVIMGSGAISSSAANSTNPAPSKGGLASHPAHLAVLISGIVVAVFFIIFLATCVMIRSKKQQNPGEIYTRYQDLRRKIGFPSQDIIVGEDDKILQMEKDGMSTSAKLHWDPESSFTKPLAKLEQPNPQEAHTSIFRKAVTGANSCIPHIKARPKSLVLQGYNTTFGLPKVLPAYEEIQPLAKAHTVESNRPSTQLVNGQGKGNSRNILPPGFISKFSWTTTPSTNTHTRSSMNTLRALRHQPTVDENDAATVYTEDTEPARFRSTTSWVLQQQVKSQQNTQSNPDNPKPPPSDIDSSISEDSRVAVGALPGIAV
ncbi:hypothetical protein ACJ72_03000 [Emergomyces africanus]|uniref:Uncharacterized protein n=1 Tax=Emergomyces africanus TaxID=1955775 RepID=A0A1B7P0X0_9EURO|nr:hypothetical protein ACJ72_03000 [Emergomyces africanus]